jgi:hypothetical protein
MDNLWGLLGLFFFLIGTGVFLHRVHVANAQWLNVLNSYTINCSFPILIFYGLIQRDIPYNVVAKIIDTTGAALLIILTLCVLLFKFTMKNRSKGATWIIALVYGNVAFLGIPLVAGATKNELLAILLSSFHLIFSLFIGLLVTGVFQSEGKMNVKQILLMVLKNPLLIAIILGVAANTMGLRANDNFVMNSFLMIRQSATPIILISIGIFISIHLKDVRKEWKSAIIYSFSKMLIVPAIGLFMCSFFELDSTLLVGTILQLSMPMAVAPFVLAKKFNYDAPMLAGFIVLSTLLVPLSVGIWSLILG